MQEAREAVAKYATTLANPSTQIEAALTRAEPLILTPTTNELNEEALYVKSLDTLPHFTHDLPANNLTK